MKTARNAEVLPHNLDAERSVIGAVIIENAAYIHAAKQIQARHFYRSAHQQIYAAIESLLERPSGCADLVTVCEEIKRRGQLEEVGGAVYLASLVDGVPRSTNVGHYAAIVRDKALLRELIHASSRVLTDAYTGEESGTEILNRADAVFVELQHGTMTGRMRSTAASSHDLMEALEWRHAHRGQLTGASTGFQSIDDQTGGWQAGDLIVIAARPSIGKTAFVLCSAIAAARGGSRVALFSMEMRRLQIEFRALSILSGVPLSALLGGWMKEEQWPKLSAAISELSELPINIDDAASRTVRDVRAECRRLRAEGGLGLVVVDYIQLMHGTTTRRGATRNEEMTEISRSLKILADELSAPIVVLSQLNRAGEARADHRPKLSDLRESGALEQDADLVCFLHRKHHRESGVTNFIIEKQRNGPTGTVNLTIERETTKFIDGGEEPVPTKQEQEAENHEAKVKAIIRRRARGR